MRTRAQRHVRAVDTNHHRPPERGPSAARDPGDPARDGVADDGPGVCVVARWFGARSQVWVWRQVRGFRRLRPSVLSWTYENAADFPLDGAPLRLVGTKEEPNHGRGRWIWRLRNLPSRNLYGTQGAERRQLQRLVREARPSVLLCHFGHTALRLLPVAQAEGIPVVAHFHGLDISSSLQRPYYRWSLRNSIQQFAQVVCVGTHQRERLIGLGMPADRVHVIPCGVPTGEFEHRPRDEAGGITFICVCRLVRWKGVHHAIGALARIIDRLPDARLVVAGEGEELDRLRQLAADRGVAHAVEFVGAKSSAEVHQLLARADVFLQHSLTDENGWCEGFGVSIAEAAATGLPVVVSDCGGITEQVIDGVTGVVVPERDETGMADAMMTLACDPGLRARMGEAGRQRMVEHFDVENQVRKLEDVLLTAVQAEVPSRRRGRWRGLMRLEPAAIRA